MVVDVVVEWEAWFLILGTDCPPSAPMIPEPRSFNLSLISRGRELA
jgi:hypothetical protein